MANRFQMTHDEALAQIAKLRGRTPERARRWVLHLRTLAKCRLDAHDVLEALERLGGDPDRPPGIVQVAKQVWQEVHVENSRRPGKPRQEYRVPINELLPKGSRFQPCHICGQAIEKGTLEIHVRRVHKVDTPDVRLQEILDSPELAKLRSLALAGRPHKVERAQWHMVLAHCQEVAWFASQHTAKIKPDLLAEVQRRLRLIERAFTDGWIQVQSRPDTPTAAAESLDPPEYKPRWVHIVSGGLPDSGR